MAVSKDHAADFHLEYLLYDPVCSRRQYMLSEYGVNTAANNAEVLEKSSVVFVAVKPQIFPEIEDEIAANYREGQIILSIMAGIDIATVGKKLPKDAKNRPFDAQYCHGSRGQEFVFSPLMIM